MAKQKMTITITAEVLAGTDADAQSAGLNRSEYVERVLRREHYRRGLAAASPPGPVSEAEQRRLRRLLDWQRDPNRGDLPYAA